MAIKSYKKLTKGPLGLGKGRTITDDTFNDKDVNEGKGFNEVNKKKLKGALRVGLVKEIDKLVDTTDKSLVLDNEVEALTEKLERITTERDDALAELAELKGGEEDAWITMSEEELAKEYTVPELRKIIKDEFTEYKLGRGLKEAELAKLIVELVAVANAEFDANLNDDTTGGDEGSDTEDTTGESGEGTEA